MIDIDRFTLCAEVKKILDPGFKGRFVNRSRNTEATAH